MFAEKYADEIEAILNRFPRKKSAVLPLMHLAQEEYGHLSRDAMRAVAEVLDLDPTHILSLAGFYSMYYEEPVGTYVLEICNDLACALRGADEFVNMVCRKLDVPVEGTTNDGMFTVKTVMCLGACDRAPMLQCNYKFAENLDEEKFDALVEEWRNEARAEAENGSGSRSEVVPRITAYARKERKQQMQSAETKAPEGE